MPHTQRVQLGVGFGFFSRGVGEGIDSGLVFPLEQDQVIVER